MRCRAPAGVGVLIQGFFDAMSHSWTLRFLKHRIADKRILRLVAKWLRVGVVEAGREIRSERGAPQGVVVAPRTQKITFVYAAGRGTIAIV